MAAKKKRAAICPKCIDFPKGSATANACPRCHGKRNETPAPTALEKIMQFPGGASCPKCAQHADALTIVMETRERLQTNSPPRMDTLAYFLRRGQIEVLDDLIERLSR